MDSINEKSSYTVTAAFTNEDGSPVTPSLGSYRIDDEFSGTQIKGDTPFTPSSSTFAIVIAPNDNRILDSAKSEEVRVITVTFVYGTTMQGSGEYRYKVLNLKHLV